MRLASVLLLIGLVVASSAMVQYRDEVGQKDWTRQGFGKVEKVVMTPENARPKHLFVSTSEGVIAQLNFKTGGVVWRHVLPEGQKVTALALQDRYLSCVSESESSTTLELFGVEGGVQKRWSWPRSANPQPTDAPSRFLVSGNIQIVLAPSQVTLIDTKKKQNNIVTVKGPDRTELLGGFVNAKGKVLIVAGQQKNTVLAVYALKDGSIVQRGTSLEMDASIQSIRVASDGSLRVTTKIGPAFKISADYGKATAFKGNEDILSFANDGQTALTQTAAFYASGNGLKSLATHSSVVAIGGDVSFPCLASVRSNEEGRYDLVIASQTKDQLKVTDTLKLDLTAEIESVHVKCFSKKDGVVGHRILVVSRDAQVLLVAGAAVKWTRHEALSDPSAKVILLHSEHEDEFVLESNKPSPFGIMISAVEEWTGIDWRAVYPERIVALVERVINAQPKQTAMHTARIICVVSTKYNTVIGLRARDGAVLWTRRFKGEGKMVSVVPAHAVATTAHALLSTPHGYTVHTISSDTGATLSKHDLDISGKLVLTRHLAKLDAMLLVSKQGDKVKASMFPSTAELLMPLYVWLGSEDDIVGYHIQGKAGKLRAEPVWNFAAPEGSQLVIAPQLSSKPFSPARVLGNRSALYKYINPGLLGVAIAKKETTSDGTDIVECALLDTVTGQVLVRRIVRNASPPLVVHTFEHTAVFSYWNVKLHRFEVLSMQLYEPKIDYTNDKFSSFSHTSPIVLQQSFILTHKITHLTSMQTKHGLAGQYLVIGLQSGDIASIPHMFLDPRRPEPDKITKEEQKEGLMVYTPYLGLPPSSVISYNQPIAQLSHLQSYSTQLESTSIIIAHGIDLFYRQLQPSAFDQLSHDFNYEALILAITTAIILTFIVQRMSNRKTATFGWQ